MERINTKSELIERLKDVLAVEIKAKQGYEQDVSTFKNFEITDTMEIIVKDEEKHINTLKNLIKLLELNYNKI